MNEIANTRPTKTLKNMTFHEAFEEEKSILEWFKVTLYSYKKETSAIMFTFEKIVCILIK
jgi:hypothetical protein